MNPNPRVNQAAAVVLTDTNTARKLSIPRDKWVFPHGGADATDKWFISERINYYSSPAIRMNVAESLKYAGLDLSGIHFFDLYSCFPCAVIISALEIGLDINSLPPLSITGGLSYFGGPGSNYVMHAIAHAVARLRKNPEQFGLITGNGWYLTKHSTGIYSGIEPKRPWDRKTMKAIQPVIDAMPSPVFCERPKGQVTIETYTVLHDLIKEGPVAVIIGKLDSGARCMALSGKDLDLAFRPESPDATDTRRPRKSSCSI
jgi:acetyl-CoA C-acetyltransferase